MVPSSGLTLLAITLSGASIIAVTDITSEPVVLARGPGAARAARGARRRHPRLRSSCRFAAREQRRAARSPQAVFPPTHASRHAVSARRAPTRRGVVTPRATVASCHATCISGHVHAGGRNAPRDPPPPSGRGPRRLRSVRGHARHEQPARAAQTLDEEVKGRGTALPAAEDCLTST